jgi:hypothetical protein
LIVRRSKNATVGLHVRLPFAAQQVLSTLAGVKDITRRPVRVPWPLRGPIRYLGSGNPRSLSNWSDPTLWGIVTPTDYEPLTLAPADPSDNHVIPHKYGSAGDLIVVTEAWRVHYDEDTRISSIEYRADGAARVIVDEEPAFKIAKAWAEGRRQWRPGRFMPNWASRLLRENVSVIAQRLHAIDDADVAREGVGWETADRDIFDGPVDYFAPCWNCIYGETDPWEEDGWVRRIQFTRTTKELTNGHND